MLRHYLHLEMAGERAGQRSCASGSTRQRLTTYVVSRGVFVGPMECNCNREVALLGMGCIRVIAEVRVRVASLDA